MLRIATEKIKYSIHDLRIIIIPNKIILLVK